VAASANIHPGRVSLFEPVHGSAPPFAGKNIANPIGSIMTVGMILDYLGKPEAAAAIERAVVAAIEDNQVTQDIGGSLSTTQDGSRVAGRVGAHTRVET